MTTSTTWEWSWERPVFEGWERPILEDEDGAMVDPVAELETLGFVETSHEQYAMPCWSWFPNHRDDSTDITVFINYPGEQGAVPLYEVMGENDKTLLTTDEFDELHVFILRIVDPEGMGEGGDTIPRKSICDSCLNIGWDRVGNKNPDAVDNWPDQVKFMIRMGGMIAHHSCEHNDTGESCDCGCRNK